MDSTAESDTTRPRGGRWIDDWRPEDPAFWARTGRRVATRNLWFSVLAEHIGFSIWTLFSVLVLFMGPAYGIDPAGKFLLVAVATAVGATLRLPYSLAVALVGGRNWTVISAALLLVPSVLAAVVMTPGTSYTTFLVVAALTGLGGGNFASSMTNINTFFPAHRKGLALGVNAGGGNVGVAVIQLVALLIIATAGPDAPRLLLAIYIPLIVVALAGAALFMDNITSARNDTGALAESCRQPQTWLLSFLYIGTFGSFIGYSFAFGLVLQHEFGRSALQAAALTFIGPLLGSLVRPLGGWASDRLGGARVTFATFVAMAAAAVLCLVASSVGSLGLSVVGFVALFVTSGVGNGSIYKMIPSIFRTQALTRVAEHGADAEQALLWARRISGAVIGITAAVGAFGGLLINLAFRSSFAQAGSGEPAFWSFLAFYAVCGVATYVVYLSGGRLRPAAPPALGVGEAVATR